MKELIAVMLIPIAAIVGLALLIERVLHAFTTAVRFVRYATSGGDDAE
jgi:hypothetical protein